MTEIDAVVKKRTETSTHIQKGLIQFLSLNDPSALESIFKNQTDFKPIHPSEKNAHAYQVLQPRVQQTLNILLPDTIEKVALIQGTAYLRLDMDTEESFTIELAQDLRISTTNSDMVLYVQLTVAALNTTTLGVTRIEFASRPGKRHDLLNECGFFEDLNWI